MPPHPAGSPAPHPEAVITAAGRRQPVANRVLGRVLRSPASGLVDGSLMLLTVRGRRTGREVTLPVQYAAGDDALWVWPGHPQTKAWWRNLRTESELRLRLRGEDVTGSGRVVTSAAEPALFAGGWQAYAARYPRAVRAAAGGGAAEEVLVRIEVPAEALARARRATVVAGRARPRGSAGTRSARTSCWRTCSRGLTGSRWPRPAVT
jgi:hypothetical protein